MAGADPPESLPTRSGETARTFMTITNHVFVDYQNMKRVDPAVFGSEKLTSITLLLGRQNLSLELSAVKELLRTVASVELVRIEKDGKDAVDFTLVYYLGRKTVADPTAFFHIVSADKGFDPMIAHLKPLHIKVTRHEDFDSLLKALKPKDASAEKATTNPGGQKAR